LIDLWSSSRKFLNVAENLALGKILKSSKNANLKMLNTLHPTIYIKKGTFGKTRHEVVMSYQLFLTRHYF